MVLVIEFSVLNDYRSSISSWNFLVRRKLTSNNSWSSFFEKLESKAVAFGFVFDPVTNDYKIMGIPYPCNHNSNIYSMKKDFWSKIASPTTMVYYVKSKAGFLNGTLPNHQQTILVLYKHSIWVVMFLTRLCCQKFGELSN